MRKHLGTCAELPAELQPLLEAISDAYIAADEDQRILQHAMETMSDELVERNRLLEKQLAERELLENELLRSQKLESVGQLAAGLAHEINTPIQYAGDSLHFLRDAVLSLITLARRGREIGACARCGAEGFEALWQELDADFMIDNVPPAVERAVRGVSQVGTIVEALRSFASPDEREKAPVDLNQAIRQTLALVGDELRSVADVEVQEGALPPVLCHASEINQVLLQLVLNAAQAIAEVPETGRGRICIATKALETDIVISVADTGPGIHPRIRDRIYDPFFTTKEVGKGTGQGLAVAHSIVVKRHSGAIWFETGPGRGTTFYVRLPVRARGEEVGQRS